MKRVLFVLAAVATLFTACNQDVLGTLYDESFGAENGAELGSFTFAASVLNLETGSEDQNMVLIPIYRGNLNQNVVNLKFEIEAYVPKDTIIDNSLQTVQVKQWVAKDTEGLFSLATERVVFQDGQYMAYARVSYTDINSLSLINDYRIRLSLLGGVSPSNKSQTVVSLKRRLTFEYLGECTYIDSCLFAEAYKADVYRAKEAEVYRIMDPYSEGLLAEEYAAEGMAGKPASFVQITVLEDNSLKFDPICTGMLIPDPTGADKMHMTYAYHAKEYGGNSDFSMYEDSNRKVGDKRLELIPIYCLPTFHFGHLNGGGYDGAFPLTIILP